MGNKLAVRTEYFKTTQAKGEIGHVMRQFAKDKNVLDERLTKGNFGTRNEIIFANWAKALDIMPEHTKNTLLDSVLVLPLEQINKLKAEQGKNWYFELSKAIGAAMKEMEQELGFKALGFRVHMDEGHFDENGKAVINPHAHMLFANVCDNNAVLHKTQRITQKGADGKALRDPKNPSKYLYARDENGEILTETKQIPLRGRSPLSLLQTRGSNSAWAKQQDIAAKHLAKHGFERGLSKEISNREHKKKPEWVKHRMEEQRAEIMAEINLQVEKTLEARETLLRAFREDHLDDLNKLENEFLVEFEGIDNEQIRSNILNTTEKAVERMKKDDCAFISTPALNAAENSLKRTREAHKAKSTPTIKPKM